MYTIEASRLVHAPASVVWAVISDQEYFGIVAPNLSSVQVLSGHGQGMRRRCTGSDGDAWEETCLLWDEGQRYRFEVDHHSPTYPLSKMIGTFGLEEQADGVRIILRFDYIPKFNPPVVGWLVNQLARRSGLTMCEAIFDGWEAAIHQRLAAQQAA
jgi:hypothetical protein